MESKGKLFRVNILEQQLKTEPLSDPATPLLGLYLKEMKPVSQRYCTFMTIHSSQDLETTYIDG